MTWLQTSVVWLTVPAALGAVLAGCSGGGGSSSAAAPAAATVTPTAAPSAPPPPAPAPPPPAPAPADLEAALRTALGGAGIGAVTLRPAESPALVALGEALFFDKELSGNRNISCASCHHPQAATGDALPLSLGEGATGQAAARTQGSGAVIPRHAPHLFHVGARHREVMFWDGRVRRDPDTGALTTPEPALNGTSPARPDLAGQLTSALAAQAMFPVTSAEEMRGQAGENELADAADNLAVWAALMARLVGTSNGAVGGIEAYRTLFRAAYPAVTNLDELTFAHAARAIAAWEAQRLAFFSAPLDRWLAGDAAALSDQAKRGGLVFTGRGRCAACHRGPLLSDFAFHALAVPQLGPGKGGEPDDRGQALESGDRRDDYRFRTPSLRNVSLTAPYFHDGAFPSLEAVLRHYADPANSLLGYDPAAQLPAAFRGLVDTDPTRNQARIALLDGAVAPGIPLGPQDRADLLAFLQALTDPAAAAGATAPASVPSGLPVAD